MIDRSSYQGGLIFSSARIASKRCFYATYPLVRRECTIVILLGSGLRIVCTLWSTLVTTRRSFNAAGK